LYVIECDSPVDVQNVAVFFSREFGVRVTGDEVTELTVLPTELAVRISVLVDFCLGGLSVPVLGGKYWDRRTFSGILASRKKSLVTYASTFIKSRVTWCL
jgi:hypothetical protein